MTKSQLSNRLHDKVLRIARTTKDWKKAAVYVTVEKLLK
jgi:hypothetical protein